MAGFLCYNGAMPTTHLRLAIALLAAVVLGGCARPAAAPRDTDTAAVQGADTYRRRCAPCHGSDARGDGPVAPALRTPPPDLTRLAAANGGVFPHDRVVAIVRGDIAVTPHGTREMPVWSQQLGPSSGATAAATLWSARQLELLAAYLATLQVDQGR
jgi:mono/diheme cytochrome c family protein